MTDKNAARLKKYGADEIAAAVKESAAIFSSVRGVPNATARPDFRKAYTICMTPRSGSTHLADVMGQAGVFGHPQEYLHRIEPTALASHAALYGATSWDSYLAALAARTCTVNGIFGVKADPNMLLPLLVDGSFDRTLARGKFVYITRADLVMQAISLTKAQRTGAWTQGVESVAKAEFNFNVIYRNVLHLAEMMGRWEAFFAFHGILPLRLTYERIDSQISEVLSELGAFLGVSLPAPVAVKTKSYQRNEESEAWRTRFLKALNSA